MSLIVCRIIDNTIIVLGDTKLTIVGEGLVNNKPSQGVIKTIIYLPNISISFAGNLYFVEHYLPLLPENKNLDFLIDFFFKIHQESNPNTDSETQILITLLADDSITVTIKDGEIHKSKNGWIGSQRAFKKFRENEFNDNISQESISMLNILRKPEELNNDIIVQKLFNAFCKVVEDETIEEVGGFVIPVMTEKNCHSFFEYVSAFRKPIENYELNKDIYWGDAKDGSFMTNFWGSNESRCAIHFYQGNLGIIYNRENKSLMIPQIFYNVDEIDFVDLLKKEYEDIIGWTYKHTPDEFGIKGNFYFNKNEYEKALDYYNRGIKLSSKNWGTSGNIEYHSLADFFKNQGEITISIENARTLKILLYSQGKANWFLGKFEQGLINGREAILIDNTYIDAILLICRCHFNLNNHEKAFESLNKFTSINGEYLETLILRGEMNFALKQYNEAQLEFLKVLEIDSENVTAKEYLLKLSFM